MEEQKLKEEKTSKRISYIILGISFLIVIIGVVMLLTNNGPKKKNGEYKPDDPKQQNDVKVDGITYSILKLETNKNNLVYSPLSIKYALSMLKEGAVGDTKKEIEEVLTDAKLTKYEDIDKVLSLANSVFIRDTFKEYVLSDYTNKVKTDYNAEIVYDEFNSAENVNKWIEEKTFGLIKNMLKDEQVQNADVEMLLINALAIDMQWNYEFAPDNTSSRPFTKENGEKIDVAMMHMVTETKGIKYYQNDDYTEVALPFRDYNGTQLEFIALMPNEKDLNEMILSDGSEKTIQNLLSKIEIPADNVELSISLPRFDYDYKASLKNDLYTMGIKTAFSPAADFSKIASSPLQVDDVLHKATIKCTEKGVKAAAATVIIMKDNSAIMDPMEKTTKYLNFNKPFMFIIRDVNTEEIWFVGTVYEPILWKSVKKDYNYQ